MSKLLVFIEVTRHVACIFKKEREKNLENKMRCPAIFQKSCYHCRNGNFSSLLTADLEVILYSVRNIAFPAPFRESRESITVCSDLLQCQNDKVFRVNLKN